MFLKIFLSALCLISFKPIKAKAINDFDYKKSPYSMMECKVEGAKNSFKFNDFSFGYIGKEEKNKINVSYQLFNKSLDYEVYILYSYMDGDLINGYEDYIKKDEVLVNQDYDASFIIDRKELSNDVTEFYFYIEARESKDDLFNHKVISKQEISFCLTNYETTIKSYSPSINYYYYVEYFSYENKIHVYFDSLDFVSYLNIVNQDIYFRIKPNEFRFKYEGNINKTYVEFVLLTSSSVFNTCADFNSSYGRSFIFDLDDTKYGTFNLKYRDINSGGRHNLYLDTFSMHMYKVKAKKYYEVKNIYLPKNKGEVFKELNVLVVFKKFGVNMMDLIFPLTIKFNETFIDEYYYVEERIIDIDNDVSLEVINIWLLP